MGFLKVRRTHIERFVVIHWTRRWRQKERQMCQKPDEKLSAWLEAARVKGPNMCV